MPQIIEVATGCSSGFGQEYVHEILARGDGVIATGGNPRIKLIHLEETGAAILDLEVTSPQTELDEKLKRAILIFKSEQPRSLILGTKGPVDILNGEGERPKRRKILLESP
ncbi:hypothetical protein IFR05_007240 [Cadophora sp. M221]|nr:hypothetical protein IFR05_007240 [Cadophora sp. M221]